jgi:hypothetical protein
MTPEPKPEGADAMDALWPAIVGAVGTVTAAVIAGLFGLSARQASVRKKSYDQVTGTINEPHSDQPIGRTFRCSGKVTGMQPGLSLWLAVEVGPLVWPKESIVAPDQDNNWSTTVFEDGATAEFAVGLYVGDAKVDRRIRKWFEEGKRTGNYSELRGIPDARRLARTENLRLNPGAR